MDKFYGYGIVDKDGARSGYCRNWLSDSYHANKEVQELNGVSNLPGQPYRVVELFYKDEQS